jgi:ATP-dependent exoDNAse (exonuclease V) beta subunit
VPFVYALAVSGEAERLVLRGIIDCVLRTKDGLLVLDYKTDRRSHAEQWEERLKAYRVQLQLYALAAAEILAYGPARAALVFMREHHVERVPVEAPPVDELLLRTGVTVSA